MRNSALMGCMSQRAGERRGRVSTYSGYSFLISRGTRSAHRLRHALRQAVCTSSYTAEGAP